MGKTFCKGEHCPVSRQCLRYTQGLGATIYEGSEDKFINSCTNQRKFEKDDAEQFYPLLKIPFDVMLGDRFVCSMAMPVSKMEHGVPLFSEKDFKSYVETLRPSLKGKNYRIEF